MSDSKNTQNQDEINKVKAKIMYDELIVKYDYIKNDANEEKIIEKIIELNFDEEAIKNYYDVQRIYDELEDEYGISGFIEVDDMKNKIKELNCNRQSINEWIESYLSGNI